MSRWGVLVLVMCAVLTQSVAEENLLINPGFETCDPTGWSYCEDYPYDGDGPPVDWPGYMIMQVPGDILAMPAYEGESYVSLGGAFFTGRGFIYQEVAVIPGSTYRVGGAVSALAIDFEDVWTTDGNAQLYIIQGAWQGPSNPGYRCPPAGAVVTLLDLTSPCEWVYQEAVIGSQTNVLTLVLAAADEWFFCYFSGKLDSALVALYEGPPMAEFDALSHSGCSPLLVTFTDESLGNPTSWEWDFGDGGTSQQKNPSHTYLSPGTYTVTLSVSNGWGSDAEIKADYVVVMPGAPGPPGGVSASDGAYCNKVRVEWDQAPGADSHRVYRSTSGEPTGAEPLSAWLVSTQFDDPTAQPGQSYWYWVRARNTCGESDLSIPDEGWATEALYVDLNAPGPIHDGSSWDYAFLTIQDAIDSATNGDDIIVAPGSYVERLSFEDSGITSDFTLRSTDPNDPAVVAATVVTGDLDGVPETPEGSVITFSESQSSSMVISGLTITGGNTTETGGGIYGGKFWRRTGARISDCVITGNVAEGGGGGIYGCDGPITRCRISGNSSGDNGGGLSDCGGPIVSCVIAENSADASGAAWSSCGGPIVNCTITANLNEVYSSEASGVINCIIWGNGGSAQSYNWLRPSLSCLQDWSGGGCGNFTDDPCFVDAEAGDYRLRSDSPCIDVGRNGIWFPWGLRDAGGDCRLAGVSVDMGAFEYGSSPDSDGDLLADDQEPSHGTDADLSDSDMDGVEDGLELLRGTDPTLGEGSCAIEVPADFPTIQEAIGVAGRGDEVIVSPGTHTERMLFLGRDITVRSSDPDDPGIVSSTVIDGDLDADSETREGPVVVLHGTEIETCTLSGLTITGGNYGGIFGNGSRATIRQCVVTGNVGAAIDLCHGPVIGCDISENAACGDGSLYRCNGLVDSNIISGNSGPALYWCHGTISRNVISGNLGSGLVWCEGPIVGNVVSGNDGLGVSSCDGLIADNMVSGNAGAGLSGCCGTIASNTITGNVTEYEAGGVRGGEAPVTNCIIWGNTGTTGAQVTTSGPVSYSCIQDWTGGGEGNIADDPLFIAAGYWTGAPGMSDWVDGDYRLSHIAAGQAADSPCIDAGDPASTATFGSTRTDGVYDAYPLDMGYHYGDGTDESSTPPGWFDPGWNLISLPLVPDCAVPDLALFDAVLAGNSMRNNLFRYSPGLGYEIYCCEFYKLGVGEGYWLYLEHACDCTLTGRAVSGDFNTPIASGWNIVGCPHPNPVWWAGCEVTDGVTTKTVPEAEAAGWIQATIYYYDGNYGTVTTDGAGDDIYLRPWHGYWLLAYQPGLVLIVPVP